MATVNDHTRAEATQWALNHAEAAEGLDKALRHETFDPDMYAKTLAELHREVLLSNMWSGIAQAMEGR